MVIIPQGGGTAGYGKYTTGWRYQVKLSAFYAGQEVGVTQQVQ